MKPKLFLFLLLIIFSSTLVLANQEVVIYKNAACGHCNIYLNELSSFLKQYNLSITEKDMINDFNARLEMDKLNKDLGITMDVQGHMTAIINNLILEGHIPIYLLKDYFDKYPDLNFPKLIVYQDSMDENIKTYQVKVDDAVKECDIKTSISDCITSKVKKKNALQKFIESSFLLLIITTGFLAGIHPCTIAVLLFFVAFLFTLHRTRAGIFKIGLTYIIGVFLAYFFIGLGLLKAIILFEQPHAFARIAAFAVIILGLVNIKEFFWYGKWISLGIPHASKKYIIGLVHKAPIPAALILGMLVGLCSFGCTAGIYFSILGLLLTKATQGFFYLLMYNIMFILPLIIILIIASNRNVVEKMEKLEESEKKYVKLIAGIIMIILGILIFSFI